MKFLLATVCVIAMLAFGIAAAVEVVVTFRNVFTAHPFKAVGNLVLVLGYGVITALFWWGARTVLDKENA